MEIKFFLFRQKLNIVTKLQNNLFSAPCEGLEDNSKCVYLSGNVYNTLKNFFLN